MSIIRASVTDQRLKITEAPVIAAGGLSEVKIVFDFCEKWDGFVKTAIFYRDEENVYYGLLDAENTCIVPWEVCFESGTFYIGVFGVKDDVRRTSTVARYRVKKGAITDDTRPSDPTPDVYDQIIAMLSNQSGGSADAVLYTEQTLTGEEKAQARKNIGAAAVGEAGGGNAKVHVGPDAPTDEDVTLWVDTDEEASGGGGGADLMLFCVNGYFYLAENNTEWGVWIGSRYNTRGLTFIDREVLDENGDAITVDGENAVDPHDLIDPSIYYQTL